jgi:hypothetical protein
MPSHPFDNAPNLNRDFTRQHDQEIPLEIDALNWESVSDHEFEEPSEKHLELHYRPGGALEQEVHTQIDRASRRRIEERDYVEPAPELPDEQELNFGDNFRFSRAGDKRDERGDDVTALRFERGRGRNHNYEREH